VNRDTLQWLYPGLGIKRWLLLAAVGVVLLSYSVLFAIGARWSPELMNGLGLGMFAERPFAAIVLALDGIVVGGLMVVVGAQHAWVFHKTTPETAKQIRATAKLARGPRIVAIGGGHGLAALLRGLKSRTSNLTAVVTMADDGGSSGLLRRDMGMPPPGDLRNCLVALADDESLMSRLFQYRFPDSAGLHAHSFGNLFMAALADVTGDFELAVQESTRVLKVRGRVLPSTLDDVVLHAQLEGGDSVSGESTIAASGRLPRRVWLTPESPRALPQAIAAISRADLVVLGPGSLYTSVMPNLLIPEVRAAVRDTRALVVYVCNVMTEPGETDGYSAADHLDALQRHGLRGVVDVVLVNDEAVSEELLAAYRREGAAPVAVDEQRLRERGVRIMKAPLVSENGVVRHDSQLLAQALERLL
jgi:uncharacterized cofD-like protein